MRNSPGEGNANYRHGHSVGGKSKTYVSWQAMRTRCYNPANKRYKDYGERGIGVCKRWDKFANFLADMGERPANMTCERKNVHKGYSKSNCIWADAKTQARNQRSNRNITFEGKTMCLAAWAEQLGVTSDCLWKRLKKRGLIVLSNTKEEAPEWAMTIHI